MIIGFIGFGEVASTLSKKLMDNGAIVKTSSKDRSHKTQKLIAKSNVEDIKDYKELAKNCDILISTNTPSNAIAIGKKYAKYSKLFLDLNNISPSSTKEIANVAGDKFVDGAIIGRVNRKKSIIYLSGKNANKIAILNEFGLKTKIISDNIGDATTLKMLRSMYTKGISAILMETFDISKKLGLSEELLDTIAITECDDFKTRAKSRINGSIKHHKRKYEEMNEITEYLNEIAINNNLRDSNSKYNKLIDNEVIDNKIMDNELMEAIKNKFKYIVKD
ncbi:DUF1932 domain-containing protein [Methanobrevibacter filiformis]|uniref:Tartronate semialdehyde reductase n=1 Tax=Methanobrevibacter filiformis TaxID=55758 RepID=A0A166D3L4_9EURY|nr:NAD(P)-binding domain-containing protein [Methanobrevibacter filiformis]KZX15166.1 tartronate semialdehyde reductase [Methanobrevibacter filiformis]